METLGNFSGNFSGSLRKRLLFINLSNACFQDLKKCQYSVFYEYIVKTSRESTKNKNKIYLNPSNIFGSLKYNILQKEMLKSNHSRFDF